MTTRRLAAILAADVVGYSRLMGADETGTLGRLRALRREVIDPLTEEHGGRVFKTTGDGMMVEFQSAVQALRCAMAIQDRQRSNGSALHLRIGLHQGDVVIDGDDVLGDGVNIAARIEPLAGPGGICISGRVREDAVGKIALDVEDLGTPLLKNIAVPVRVFRLRLGEPERPALALPDKPSVAVLPLQNQSGDGVSDYFADGITDDVTTALSYADWLFVISRNSAFTYKGRVVDVAQVGRELGVRHVLDGSVRRAGGRMRISGRLVEAATGAEVWADRVQGDVAEIFDIQYRFGGQVAAAIEPDLDRTESRLASLRPTRSLDAYDLYLRAVAQMQVLSKAALDTAIGLLRRALEIDPGFVRARGFLAFVYGVRSSQGSRNAEERAMALALADEALAAGQDDPLALRHAGQVLCYFARDYDRALVTLTRALRLNPNSSSALSTAGFVHVYLCKPEPAIALFQRAIRLSPLDPEMGFMLLGLGNAQVIAERDAEAVGLLHQALREKTNQAAAWRLLVISLIRLGRTDEARIAARRVLEIDPGFRISAHVRAFRSRAFSQAYVKALRMVGLPE